jgi:DNA-binding transcriptional regulator PaaX
MENLMAEPDNKKHHYEATKQLLMDLLTAASGLTILMSRPAGSMYNPKYFYTNGLFDRTKFRRTLRHAHNYGYVGVKERRGEVTITLSEAGRARAFKYSIDDIHIIDPMVWDKKWRMVMFDIPEELRPVRNIFKAKLDEMGFAQVQKSAYVHPYPCHNEIEFIRSLYGLNQYIRLAIIDRLEGDEDLKKRFGL